MNTPRSVFYGWGVLIVAAGGAFYYAKKEVDARRREQRLSGQRPTEKKEWYQRLDQQNAPVTGVQKVATAPKSQTEHLQDSRAVK